MVRAWFYLLYAVVLLKARSLESLIPMLQARKVNCARALTLDEANAVFRNIRRAKRFLLWRNACLEESLALFLLVTGKGKAVDWCVGVRLAPFASHAWIEVKQVAIGESVCKYEKIINV